MVRVYQIKGQSFLIILRISMIYVPMAMASPPPPVTVDFEETRTKPTYTQPSACTTTLPV